MELSTMYEKAWKAVLTPEAFRHKTYQFGPSERTIDDQRVFRTDIKVKSCRGREIEGFVFHDSKYRAEELIVYLHGSGGSKLEAMGFLNCLPKYGLAAAAMDFAGCGNSEHELLTYGHRQAEDVKIFLDEVKRTIESRSVTIWGRSMGAVTAILFAHRYGDLVQGLILDGPFRRLEGIIERLAYQNAPHVPKAILDGFIFFLKRRINLELDLGHCLFETDYVKHISELDPRLALLVIYSNFDTMVPTNEAFQFYNAFPGRTKETFEIFQSHNEQRHKSVYEEAIKWMVRKKPIVTVLKKKLKLNRRNLARDDTCEFTERKYPSSKKMYTLATERTQCTLQ